MNTKSSTHGLVTKFQKTLMVIVALLVLFGLFPVGQVNAAASYMKPSVHCLYQAFAYNYSIQGAYNGQWARYRLHVSLMGSDRIWVRATTNWTNVRVYGIMSNNIRFPAASGVKVSIITEVQFANGSIWGPSSYQYGPHYNPYAETQNNYNWCATW